MANAAISPRRSLGAHGLKFPSMSCHVLMDLPEKQLEALHKLRSSHRSGHCHMDAVLFFAYALAACCRRLLDVPRHQPFVRIGCTHTHTCTCCMPVPAALQCAFARPSATSSTAPLTCAQSLMHASIAVLLVGFRPSLHATLDPSIRVTRHASSTSS